MKMVKMKNQVPSIIWLTGLPAAGKTTLAEALNTWFMKQGYHTYLIDGDIIRQGLNCDLGFSNEDRAENIRRQLFFCSNKENE